MELIKKRLAERPSDSRLWYVNLFYISSYFSFVFILSLFIPTIIVSKRYTSKLVSSYIYCHNYDYGFRPSIFMYVSLEAFSYSSCIQHSSLTYFQLQGIQLLGPRRAFFSSMFCMLRIRRFAPLFGPFKGIIYL